MEEIKKRLTDLLWNYAEKAHGAGSCGELGDSFMAINADDFEDLAEKILIDFEPKKCMPDNINSKEEHEEYLKSIGYEKHVKYLQHFKDTTVDLWAFDCDPKELLNKFNDSQSDAHSIECGEWEQLLEDWNKFVNGENVIKSPFFQIK